MESFDAIATDPKRLGKRLTLGLEGHLSARRGPYRAIYSIDEDERVVNIVAIEHRADVYRRR